MTSRINKRLVDLGLAASRRKADELIADGAVTVNGQQVTSLGGKVEDSDVIALYGREGKVRDHVYIAFNKPVGYVCTHRVQTDKQKTIFDLLPLSFASLKIAGRLDKDSQGLMVLSSDGAFIQAVSHPSQGKSKMYVVGLDKAITPVHSAELMRGIKLKDGLSKFETITRIRAQQLRVTMSEGRNRQIRRSFEELGYKVKMLERVKIGKLELGMMRPGMHRFIKPEDVL